MKEITIFNENEKKEIMRPLLILKEQGNHEAAVKFTEMWVEGYKRALAEYKKHSEDEKVLSNEFEIDFFPMTVKEKIAELEEELAINEEWLRKA